MPYFAGERSPNLPDATGSLTGITTENFTAPSVARAAVEGLLGSLVWCREQIEAQGVDVERVLLIGGGAKSPTIRAVAPSVFEGTVIFPAESEWVALGAARQAAWTLTGHLPGWSVAT